jgi:hypothetical protein
MRLGKRLAKVATALRERGRADQFSVIEAVSVGDERAEGRAPGLYRDGPEGSTAGLLVFDPADGEPVVPEGRLAPWGLVITLGPEHIDVPSDVPREGNWSKCLENLTVVATGRGTDEQG